jgi:hypothetical protein
VLLGLASGRAGAGKADGELAAQFGDFLDEQVGGDGEQSEGQYLLPELDD